MPYLIAVNALAQEVEDTDIMDALFGTETIEIQVTEFGVRQRTRRLPDGVWGNRSSPRYTRLSAVLVASGLQAWNLSIAPVCVYHNPWATRAYRGELTRLNQRVPNGDRMEFVRGEPLQRVLGLPDDWPQNATRSE